jgi:para-nitrobenzyl esterase
MPEVTRRDFVASILIGAAVPGGAGLPRRAAAVSPRYSIATTRTGKIRGVQVNGVHVFKGVPYGADTRTQRFRAASAAASWKGVRDALDYGPACPQANAEERTSEDCLSLNVWTPTVRDKGRRPVLVYIHGGEFSTGSGSSPLYDGERLCRRGDVVVVTVNHRLSLFGHWYLARLGGDVYAASGNVGILDLVQALTWVRDHAPEFGGDPDCVTVFGQSGGGAKIATLMALPAARGLFHRAITMSGQQITASGPRGATLRARACLATMKIAPGDMNALLSLDTQALIEATHAADPTLAGRPIYFGPVLDQYTLPRHPFYPDAPPQSRNIPMIIGNTRDETRAFYGDDPAVHELTWDELPERLVDAMSTSLRSIASGIRSTPRQKYSSLRRPRVVHGAAR